MYCKLLMDYEYLLEYLNVVIDQNKKTKREIPKYLFPSRKFNRFNKINKTAFPCLFK